ncbi:MAG: hypothetical protein KKF44_08100 [Nanoarchaeota archaeon]|nr:hypothetical protein [Nanoarchaeota archaeon]
MGLFKNIYLDFGFLDVRRIFRKNKQNSSLVSSDSSQKQVQTPGQYSQPSQHAEQSENAEITLPAIPKRLILEEPKSISPPKAVPKELPRLTRESLRKKYNAQIAEEIINKNKADETRADDILKNVAAKSKESIERSSGKNMVPEKNSFLSETAVDSSLLLSEQTYFNDLLSKLSKDKGFVHTGNANDVIFNDLVSDMKDFWKNKHYNYRKDMEYIEKERTLIGRMKELHELELEWQRYQMAHHKIKNKVVETETEIESRINSLKNMFRQNHLEIDVKPEFVFNLDDGQKIRNIAELRSILPEMQDVVFNVHVNENKNDFAAWINDVIGLKDLSQNLNSAVDKKTFSEMLDKYFPVFE